MAQFPHEQSAGGEYQRQQDAFSGWVTEDGRPGYPAAKGRYHLYVSLACPWAHRTIIVRKLKKLEDAIGIRESASKGACDFHPPPTAAF